MDDLIDPALSSARLVGDWGFKLVILGVIGEVLAAGCDFTAEKLFKNWHSKWKGTLRFSEIISGAILILGLAMEYKGHKDETNILDSDNAKLHERAAQSELAAAELNVRINKTETNVANIDPLNQPIASLTATVILMVRGGTNQTNFDPDKYPEHGVFVGLSLGSSEDEDMKKRFPSWPARLICTSCNRADWKDGPDIEQQWVLEFAPKNGFLYSTPKKTVLEATKWDTIWVEANFLQRNTKIDSGHITLLINSTIQKEYEIPSQIMAPPVPDTAKTNFVTVVGAPLQFWPQKN